MTAHPYPGRRSVGGATPNPWGALADDFAAIASRYARALADADPIPATMAALSMQTNAAFARQVRLAHAVAELARDQARALAAAGERAFPQGPLQRAVSASGSLQSDLAQVVADAVLRFGREFGHLAFAFPRQAKPVATLSPPLTP